LEEEEGLLEVTVNDVDDDDDDGADDSIKDDEDKLGNTITTTGA